MKGSTAAMVASAKESGDIIFVIFRDNRVKLVKSKEQMEVEVEGEKEVATIETIEVLRDCSFLRALFTCNHERVTKQERSWRMTDLPSGSQVKLKNKDGMEYKHAKRPKE